MDILFWNAEMLVHNKLACIWKAPHGLWRQSGLCCPHVEEPGSKHLRGRWWRTWFVPWVLKRAPPCEEWGNNQLPPSLCMITKLSMKPLLTEIVGLLTLQWLNALQSTSKKKILYPLHCLSPQKIKFGREKQRGSGEHALWLKYYFKSSKSTCTSWCGLPVSFSWNWKEGLPF